MTRLDDPYDEGAAAARAGLSIWMNPYDMDGGDNYSDFTAWSVGYNRAKNMTCPPCTNSCNQGRSCSNRRKRRLSDLLAVLWRVLKGETKWQ